MRNTTAEVTRVQTYFDSRGDSLLRQFSDEREAASANLAFEDAAAIHAKVEKLKPVVSQLPEIVQRLDRLSALMIQPSHLAGSVAFFRIDVRPHLWPYPLHHPACGTREITVDGGARTRDAADISASTARSQRWKRWSIWPC